MTLYSHVQEEAVVLKRKHTNHGWKVVGIDIGGSEGENGEFD